MHDFGEAIAALKQGRKVCREGWNGRGMWLALQRPDAGSKMSLPYIYMKTVTGDLVPWLASQTDVLSEDWIVLDD
jgi:acyl CoA:acetate/3-ketoacid CoA transferase alpha subunit